LSVQYTFNNDYRIFANVARGFRPGTLEDMTRTGAINGGVVIANPDLKPEHVWSYELGADLTPCRFVTFSPSIYYTRGTDFIYNVNTGETIQMGNKERPLFRKTNLAKADIFGAEADLYFNLSEHFNLFTGFSYTHAKIKEGTASIFGKETDLAGHYMTYVPKTKVSAGFTWWNRYVNINTAYVQYSKQYIDDLNEEQLSAMGTVDLKLWHTFASKLTVSFNARNLFDRQVVDKGNLSMGRYLYGEVSLRF
ncbi:MAG: TonB-dependent receptor domain-containing protein, partial [Tannerellaceae bacterium]